MAKTAQEKADLKAEKLYEKTHKRKYRLKPGDIVFNILNYLFFTLFTILLLFILIVFLYNQSLPFFLKNNFLKFIFGRVWDATEVSGSFGIFNILLASVLA